MIFSRCISFWSSIEDVKLKEYMLLGLLSCAHEVIHRSLGQAPHDMCLVVRVFLQIYKLIIAGYRHWLQS